MPERSRALGILLVLAGAAMPALAQAPAGPEFQASGLPDQFEEDPGVAVFGDGRFVVVWNARVLAPNDADVFARRFAADGAALGPQFLVNSYTTGNVGTYGRPAVDAVADGRFVVAWTATQPPPTAIFARRFDAGGSPLGGDIRVTGFSTTPAPGLASVAMADDGSFVVVWEERGASTIDDSVNARRFDASGNPIGAAFRVNAYTDIGPMPPTIAMTPAGAFVVAWQSHIDGGTFGNGIRARRFDSAGVPQGAEFIANSTTAGTQNVPWVAMDDAGGFVIAWDGDGPGGDEWGDVFARRFDAGGQPYGPEFHVNTFTPFQQARPRVAFEADGNFVVAWNGYDPFSTQWDVFLRRLDGRGRPLGPELRVNAFTTNFQSRPVVDADANGRMVVVWMSVIQTPGEHAAMARRYGGLRPLALAADASGNGVAEPGEPAVAAPSWRNSSGAALALTGTASSFTGPAGGTYTIEDATAAYGTVADGATAACGADCYGLTAGGTRPATHWDARFTETLGSGHSWTWPWHLGDSFPDVPRASPFYRFVETLLHHGVTGGCGAGLFCPQSPTTREQMAVFVLVAREGPEYAPPACATPVFPDVPAASPFCRWVEELARRGVVSGCGGGNYCPGDAVTREQMAVFVLRTLDPALDPPACTTPVFADVPASSPFCRWIEELFRRGVVNGCGGGNYCPLQPVTREEMGVFLGVTFGLTLYGPLADPLASQVIP
jgi:hypothetical protein